MTFDIPIEDFHKIAAEMRDGVVVRVYIVNEGCESQNFVYVNGQYGSAVLNRVYLFFRLRDILLGSNYRFSTWDVFSDDRQSLPLLELF